MSEPLRLAVVGVGRMGAFHARVLAPEPTIEIVALVDPSPSAAALSAELDVPALFPDVGGLASAAIAEAWLIATPTPTHPPLVRAALAAGAHILCEKPVSLEQGVGAALDAEADARGLVLQVGFWRRFSPPWTAARREIAAGAIGRPLLMRLSQWDADPPPPEFCDPSVSGGLAIDCGVHEFDLAEWLTGGSVVRADGRNLPIVDPALGDAGDVDNLVAVLDMDGGGVAVVDLSRNARYGDDVRTEILGSHGALLVETLPAGRCRIGDAYGLRVIPGSETEDPMAAGVAAQAVAFAARTRGADVELPGGATSDRALAIGQALRRSAAAGQPVPVG